MAPGWKPGSKATSSAATVPSLSKHTVFYDITEQKKAEHGPIASAALAAAANAIVITDPSGRVEWCNPAFLHMSSYSEDEVKGQYLGEMVRSGQQSRGFYRQMWDTILAGQPWHGELTNRRKDGSQYPEQMSITPLISVHRKITHFIAIKQDISEQKRLERCCCPAIGEHRTAGQWHRARSEQCPHADADGSAYAAFGGR